MPDSYPVSPGFADNVFSKKGEDSHLVIVRMNWPGSKSISGGQMATWPGSGNAIVVTTRQQGKLLGREMGPRASEDREADRLLVTVKCDSDRCHGDSEIHFRAEVCGGTWQGVLIGWLWSSVFVCGAGVAAGGGMHVLTCKIYQFPWCKCF